MSPNDGAITARSPYHIKAHTASSRELPHPKFSPATTRPTIYQDASGKLADQFQIPGGYKFHGTITHYPALIILDREGREAFRYVGKNNTDRYPFDQFAARIAELSARSESPAATSK